MLKTLFYKHHPASESSKVATLDIGSSKVACTIAHVSQQSGITVFGCGQAASTGSFSGVVSNMDQLASSISRAVHAAEQSAHETIKEVYVNVSPSLLKSHLVTVDMSITGHEVAEPDIKALVQQAIQQVQTPSQAVIHVIPYLYKIDDSRGIKDPRGMYGETLFARVHVVTAPLSPLRNLITCVEKAHLDVIGLIATPFASGLAVLEQDEMDLGSIVLDLGAQNTSIGIFANGSFIYADVLKVGGGHITNDLAHGLSTSIGHAERLKTLHGSALSSSRTDRETIIVPQAGEKSASGGVRMPKSSLVRVIYPRVEEIFTLIRQKLHEIGEKKFSGYRVILTGGSSQLPGIQEMAGLILNQPVRIGNPIHMVGTDPLTQSPIFSCCAGQLSYIRLSYSEESAFKNPSSFFKNIVSSVGLWFKEKR